MWGENAESERGIGGEDMIETMGERVKRLAREQNLTQKELSLSSRVTEASLSHYIHGTRKPSVKAAASLARSLGVSLDYLVYGEEYKYE